MPVTLSTSYDSTDYSLRNRNYTILIRQNNDHVKDGTDAPTVIVGAVNSEFQFNQTVQWEPFWGGPTEGPLTKAFAAFGVRLVPQISTMLQWSGGGNELEFTVQFDLQAWSDPEKDVMEPIRSLMGMTLPGIGNDGFLRSPGAYIDPAFTKGILDDLRSTDIKNLLSKDVIQEKLRGVVSIAIGRRLFFDNVAITSVQYQLHTDTPFRGLGSNFLGSPAVPSKLEGAPTGATVTVTFKPLFTMTSEDLYFILLDSTGTENAHDNLLFANDANNNNAEESFSFVDDQMELIDLYDPLAT